MPHRSVKKYSRGGDTTSLDGVYNWRMTLKDFYLSMPIEQRECFAARCGTTLGQLRNVAYGRQCGEALAINIERESLGAVRCEDLRPDVDWAYLRGTVAVDAENKTESTSEAA